MGTVEEIFALATRLEAVASAGFRPEVDEPLEAVRRAANAVGRSASGSWLGHHANIYYSELKPPPPGVHFSAEWGIKGDALGRMGSSSGWLEWSPEDVSAKLKAIAGHPDLSAARTAAEASVAALRSAQSDMESILQVDLVGDQDPFASKLSREFQELRSLTASEIIRPLRPTRQIITRDTVATNQGFWTPPHVAELAEAAALSQNIGVARQGAEILTRLGSHLERMEKKLVKAARIGTNVFIGHGRSGAWRELKDFISDRLALPWDEFNRVPVAGVTNIDRLAEMLNGAAIAFLVMTAEDETADGAMQARMNVVHEAGLFQGRLGFARAIVLLEDGCSEFSNIQGLGQIRFPRGRISAAFEEIRLVLEREGLIQEHKTQI